MLKIKNWKPKLLFTLLYLLLVCGMYAFEVPCFFLALTGVPCAGCGMTRAWLALGRLDVAAAFGLHPMFWAVPLLYAYILYDGRLFRRRWLDTLCLTLLGVGFLVVWGFRLWSMT